MEKIKEWCKNNPRGAAVAGIVIIVVIILAASE
jgi:hypothetical protein